MIAQYDIVPGDRVGIFQLGDSLWYVLDLLRTHKNEYPKYDLSWDSENPHKSAIIIHLPSLTLYFPAPLQRLALISFPSLSASTLTLTYETQVLASPGQPLTRAKVGRILGPTLVNEGKDLVFPGVKFEMSATSTSGSGRDDAADKLEVSAKDVELTLPGQLMSCVIEPKKGIVLHFSGIDPLEIWIGKTTAQDLLLDLGPPLRKFWKEDDRLEKMWGGESEPGGCFWNYFQHGLDFLVSPDYVVTKILCYSNIPGTPLFQRYSHCPWVLSAPSGDLDQTSPLRSFSSQLSPKRSQYDDVQSEEEGVKDEESVSGDSGRVAGKAPADYSPKGAGKPPAMALDRAVEGGLEGVINVGESRLVGFEGLIIEEDQASGGICSVLVWKDE
ncbi:hypothetical protein I350_02026 [Cryptococcus amylolentus CBS 6273]|uniref:Uncharacterized protein n=1 Tax=Cryptococcus amylolentus CBS 6273 TaxID=1296118 RepID=A0A1E3K9M5_9TREE|nr:hypothetical protein I350_02026 [Cryptococcus amylolentus CBS 6273]